METWWTVDTGDENGYRERIEKEDSRSDTKREENGRMSVTVCLSSDFAYTRTIFIGCIFTETNFNSFTSTIFIYLYKNKFKTRKNGTLYYIIILR